MRHLFVVSMVLFLAGCLPGDWETIANPDAPEHLDLVERGWLQDLLPTSNQMVLTYNLDTNRVFLRAIYTPTQIKDLRTMLTPAKKADAVELANEHPPQLDGWDEIALQAQLRTGALPLYRPRDGSIWRYALTEEGNIWAWHIPDLPRS